MLAPLCILRATILSIWLAASATVFFSATAVTGISCTAGCSYHGVCNEELGRCDCPRHRSGTDCSIVESDIGAVCSYHGYDSEETCTKETPLHCLNACNGRGKCYAGWCKCDVGFYGADCSISLDAQGQPEQLAGLGFKPASRPPFVYIYELPPRFNTWRNLEKLDRPLYTQLWKRIISSGHRTLDISKADYFYIPTDFRFLRKDSMEVLRYVWETWPAWNATGGARHLLLSTSDLGGCEGADLLRVRNVTANATWLTAWGLTRKHPNVWWPGCHRPGVDIVIPIPALQPGLINTPLNVAFKDPPARNITFFFSGKVCGDNKQPKPPGSTWPVCQTAVNPMYSAGVRQQVYMHHAHRPGYKIVTHTHSYIQDMSSSVFCLAPTGGGHGKRQVLVARYGCIPVTITDHVLQPFEPELPWHEFSVPVAESDVPGLHHILAGISDEKRRAMQHALACAARHTWYSTMWGAIFGEDGRYDAFATLMEILRARLRNPGVPPQDLIKVDKEFARFARCELGDDTDYARVAMSQNRMALNTTQTSQDLVNLNHGLCYYGHDPALQPLAPTGFCGSSKYGKYGHPGGVVCEQAENIATCPRPWE